VNVGKVNVGKVVDKFRANPLVSGSDTVCVLVVETVVDISGKTARFYFTVTPSVFDAIWKEATIEWGARTVVDVLCISPGNPPSAWNEAHKDVRFVPAKTSDLKAQDESKARS
jgi:hypothetical protein